MNKRTFYKERKSTIDVMYLKSGLKCHSFVQKQLLKLLEVLNALTGTVSLADFTHYCMW